VPFLGRGKQDAALAKFLAARFESAKADLATAMLTRIRSLAAAGGTVAAVTPQNWLFLGSYKDLRESLLAHASLVMVAVLGEHGFDSSAAAGAFTSLVVLSEAHPDSKTVFTGLDANDALNPAGKSAVLRDGEVHVLMQAGQLRNPDSRIAVSAPNGVALLELIASSFQGVKTGDDDRFRRRWWEVRTVVSPWRFFQSTVEDTVPFGGRESMVWWEGDGALMARRQGLGAFEHSGVAVSQMRDLPATIYEGDVFDSNVAPIIPANPEHRSAFWAYCSDGAFNEAVRRIDRKVAVANATMVKVPFNLAHWQAVAVERYPKGLPEPYSDDPTQWLFHGHPLRQNWL
jgi:hypothetical protein